MRTHDVYLMSKDVDVWACCVSSQVCRVISWRWRRKRIYNTPAEQLGLWSPGDAVPLNPPSPHVAVCRGAPGTAPGWHKSDRVCFSCLLFVVSLCFIPSTILSLPKCGKGKPALVRRNTVDDKSELIACIETGNFAKAARIAAGRSAALHASKLFLHVWKEKLLYSLYTVCSSYDPDNEVRMLCKMWIRIKTVQWPVNPV